MLARRTVPGAVFLTLALLWTATCAQHYGEKDLAFGLAQPDHQQGSAPASPPALKYQQPAPAATTTSSSSNSNGCDSEQCCAYSASPADCGSTASRNKGCVSDSGCVPADNPCSAASNETGCTATGTFCKFDINTFTCKLDAAKHPCTALTSPSACAAAAAPAAGQQQQLQCRVVHVCRDACASCPSCLDAMMSFGKMPPVLRQLERQATGGAGSFQATAFLEGYCHAAASSILRASQDDLMAGCTRVAEDVVRSPALLSRPAALCKRLGVCHANCLADGTSSSSSSNLGSSNPSNNSPGSSNNPKPVAAPAKDVVDLCSPTGLLSGAAPAGRAIDPSAARDGSVCLSSADCAAGMDCDTFSASTCWPKCDPATGMDTCLSAGQCVDLCQRPDMKAVVADSARRFKPCDDSRSCARAEACMEPQFPCTRVQCDAHALSKGGDVMQFVPCGRICLPQAPRMVNASFTDSGDAIEVVLNQEAAPMNVLCSFIFDDATSASLGEASTCTTHGNILKIWLAGDVKLRPNRQPLVLGEVNALFTSAFGQAAPQGPPMFQGHLPSVAPCRNCSASAVDIRLMGPTEIAMGCENDAESAFADVDGTFMSEAPFLPLSEAGFNYVALPPASELWMIKDLKWRVESPANVSVAAVEKLVAALNNRTRSWERQMLTIPYTTLPHMPEGPVSLAVDVVNIFGARSSSVATFRKKNATESPLFVLDSSLTRFYPSAGFRLDSSPLPSACPNAKVTFHWASTIPNVDLSDATSSSIVLRPQDLVGNVEIGKTYTLTLTTQYEGSTGTHSESLTLLAVGSPLSVNLTGPSGTVPLKGSGLVYDAQGSVDPDDPFNTGSQMSFMWSCVNTADLTPCFGQQRDGKWTLDAAQLKEGVRYVVSLTIAKGDRSATASKSITPTGAQQGVVGEVVRSCGVDVATGQHLPCPSSHNPTDPLTLIVVPEIEPPFDMEDMLMEWWYDPIAVPHMTLDENNTASGVSLPSLTVLPDAIPNGGAITINVNFSVNPDSPKLKEEGPIPSNFSGTSSLTVPLNGPPYCSADSGECLAIDRSVATFPDAHFRACANGWADPEKGALTYEFGVVSEAREQKSVATNAGSCYTFASMPVGPSTLYACAVDALGARTCQEVDVAVRQPAKPVSAADLDEQLQRLNAELDGSSSSSASSLVNKAMEVTSLLTSTTKSAVNSISSVVDTTVNGFKSIYDDLKKAFGGFTLSVHSGGSTPEKGAKTASSSTPSSSSSSSTPKYLTAQSKATSSAAASSPSGMSAATTVAAANATAKLLRMMADAGSEKDADQALSLLAAGEQLAAKAPLTPQGGVALLDLAKTAMAASRGASRPLSPQMSNTVADALTRGLDAATSTEAGAKTPQKQQQQQQQQQQRQEEQQRRSLLMQPKNGTKVVLLSPDQAFSIIRDGAYKLAASQKVTLGVVEPPVGNAGICTSPALLGVKDVDGFTTEFDCHGIHQPAQVIMPAGFSAACRKRPDCSTGPDIRVISSYFSPASRSVPVVMAVVTNATHLLAEDPAVNTKVISGIVNTSLSYVGPSGSFCPGDSLAQVEAQGAACKAELELPLTNLFDTGKTAVCVHLGPDPETPGRLKPGSLEPVTSIRDVEVPVASDKNHAGTKRSKRAIASCKVGLQGMWVVAQFDASEASDAVDGSSQLSAALGAMGSYELIPGQFTDDEDAPVDKKAAATFTYLFSLDGNAVTKSPSELANFKRELQRAFLAGVVEAWTSGPELSDVLGALRLGHVAVSHIRAIGGNNNLAADVTLLPPPSTTSEQLSQLALLPPSELLLSSSALRKDLLSSERLSMPLGVDARRPSRRLSGDAIIGVVIGCVGVLAAILAAVVVVMRRRRSTVDTHCDGRSSVASDDSEAQARQALSTAGGGPVMPSDGGAHSAVTFAAAAGGSSAAGQPSGRAAAASLDKEDSEDFPDLTCVGDAAVAAGDGSGVKPGVRETATL